MDKNAIKVYQAPDMGQLDKRPVKLDGVQDFLWSPSEAIISAYTAEQGNLPARIVLVKIPERTEIRQKNLFSVSGEKRFREGQGQRGREERGGRGQVGGGGGGRCRDQAQEPVPVRDIRLARTASYG